MANITFIPPKDKKPDILRVAAYCRVSTDAKEQELSYASQIRSYGTGRLVYSTGKEVHRLL